MPSAEQLRGHVQEAFFPFQATLTLIRKRIARIRLKHARTSFQKDNEKTTSFFQYIALKLQGLVGCN